MIIIPVYLAETVPGNHPTPTAYQWDAVYIYPCLGFSVGSAPKNFDGKNAIFCSSEIADFVKNAAFYHFCHSQYEDLHFHLISMLHSSGFVAKSGVIVTNISVRNKRSLIETMTGVTNYDSHIHYQYIRAYKTSVVDV